jgi:uncharacterized membrane protein YkvA (DUF1232 family)
VKLNLKLLGNDLGEVDTGPVEEYLRSLPQLVRAFSLGLLHPRVSGWMKLYAVSGIVYFFSPLDIVPDFITGVGFLDDAIYMLLIMQVFLRSIDREVLAQILGGAAESSVFFDVREGLDAFRRTFGDLYDRVSSTFKTTIGRQAVTPEPTADNGGETTGEDVTGG